MGQKLAAYDVDNVVIGFYDMVESPPPKGTKYREITDEEWMMLLDCPTHGKHPAFDSKGKPVALDPIPPTSEQIRDGIERYRKMLLERASVALAPLQMAVSLGDATDDEKEVARQWVAFTRAVKAVALTASEPIWPEMPENTESN